MRLYRASGAAMAVTFAVVGFIFLLSPDSTLALFNNLSRPFGLPAAPLQGTGFYLALAAAYMYVVTLLAFSMYSRPENSVYAALLGHAKLASSLLSLYLFVAHRQYLVYFANFVVDGFIGAWVVYLLRVRRKSA